MTRTTLKIIVIAATIISTIKFAQATFNDTADDHVFAEVGQDIVKLGDMNKHRVKSAKGRASKHRHPSAGRRGSKTNTID